MSRRGRYIRRLKDLNSSSIGLGPKRSLGKERQMRTKIVFVLILVCVGTILVQGDPLAAAEVKRYVIGSGAMGGAWRVGLGACAQLLNEEFKDKYFFTTAASGGSVENLRRIMTGEYHTCWAFINNMDDAWRAVGIFEGQKPFKEMRVIEKVTDQACSVVVLAKSSIKTFMDFEGKKINLGPAGTGLVYIFRSVFKALGLTDKVKLSYLNHEGAAQALKDGQIDVVVSPGGPYISPAVTEISRSAPLRIVEPSVEEEKKIDPFLPYLKVVAIPPNKAPGENADKPRRAYFYSTYWIALASLPDEVIYDILNTTQDPKNKEMLNKVINIWEDAGPDFSVVAKIGVPLHPGAIKFWKEKGVKLPEIAK